MTRPFSHRCSSSHHDRWRPSPLSRHGCQSELQSCKAVVHQRVVLIKSERSHNPAQGVLLLHLTPPPKPPPRPPPLLTCASEDKPLPLSYLTRHTFILTLSAVRNGELA
ncbi:hypothetical protein E2C01_030044 [Portunus trituberculatus]|uniref:Uncharacterized protein n=1 Tax=Portunus trituberculatus TaxID=210409 RepID=A0A5B7EPW8_PORTR|nr:hypothetical protein [Portunus trituberculatus]